uniref:histidine phosphatase family protein n=1 Tax=Paracoccus sp. TRP TaxID=412597 RepID=UPI000225F298|nr:histidine phosphatase family protein [Paracoccus sp. TRP]
MAELWFIRHFRTPWNAQGRLQGRRDIALEDPLSPQGMAVLAANRQALAGRDFALVLTSPLERARRTAELHGFAAEPDPDLAEIAFGAWEGRTWAELEAAHPGAWENAPHTLPLGEPFSDFIARITRVRERALAASGPVLAFGHGAWLGGLQLAVDGGKGMPRQALGNGELVRLDLTAVRQVQEG